MMALFGEAESFVSVEIFASDELDDAFLFEVFDRAGGVGGFPSVTIKGDIEGAGVEEFDVFAMFEKAAKENALGAIKSETRIIEEAPNFSKFVGSSLVLMLADFLAAAFDGFLCFYDLLDDIHR